jgi:tripartite-type tricarboxylate transporter receptor subunit TctC
MTRFMAALASVAAACWMTSLAAQGYPNKLIRVVVPSSPGGAIDVTTRAVTPKLAEALGQPVIVDNRPGADTMIGTEMAAKAPPDGYTLLTVFDNFPLTQYLVRKVPYDAVKDFAPISLIIRGPMIVGVPAQLGVKDLNQFIQLAKSKGNLSYASAGAGTSSHLTVELFKMTTGIDVQVVHYKGAAPGVADLLGGHVQLMIAGFGTLIQQVRSGKVLALAVSAQKRVSLLPGVPTIAESYPGFEAGSWVGMLGPAGLPSDITHRLNGELVKVLADKELKAKFEDQGWEVVGSSPEGFSKYLLDYSDKWARVIRERKITLD